MVNKTISISWELDQKLKQEENASGLIQSILNQHYNSLRGTEIKAVEIQHEVTELQKEIKEKKKEIEELKVLETQEAGEEERKAEFKKRNDEATEKLRLSILEAVNKQDENI